MLSSNHTPMYQALFLIISFFFLNLALEQFISRDSSIINLVIVIIINGNKIVYF